MYNNITAKFKEVCETAVVYADSLLAVNFSMDFLALYISAKLLHMPMKPLRFAAAAGIGAVWALAVVLSDTFATSLILRLTRLILSGICAVLMVRTAYCTRGFSALRGALSFAAVNVGLGGIMTVLYNFMGRAADVFGASQISTSPDISPIMFIAAAAISGVVNLMYGKFRARSVNRRSVEVSVKAFGGEIVFQALCDSGNLLREPFGGKPVIIISAESLSNILPGAVINAAKSPERMALLPQEFSHKIRLIPAGSVIGGGMLMCFLPDSIMLEGNEVDAVAAIDTHTSDYDGCGGIVPQILLDL